jgi:hypothetical protein
MHVAFVEQMQHLLQGLDKHAVFSTQQSRMMSCKAVASEIVFFVVCEWQRYHGKSCERVFQAQRAAQAKAVLRLLRLVDSCIESKKQ